MPRNLFNELLDLGRQLKSGTYSGAAMEFLCKSKLLSLFLNISISLRILLTLPASVTSRECSFSKLKLIKTYLCSTMAQSQLADLFSVAVESQTAESIDLKDVSMSSCIWKCVCEETKVKFTEDAGC